MTPAERAKAWYPSASAGGGNNMAVYNGVGNKFLWKPKSDSNGKAAVHTPHGLRIRSLTVAGKEYGVGSYGNGWRPLFRLDKAGSAYGSNVPVVLNLHDGRAVTVIVPNGGARFEKAFAVDDTAAPDLPLPGQPPPAAKDVSEIILPAAYAPHVRAVLAVVGGKLKACVPGDTAGRKWILSGRMGAGDFFAVAWARVPDGVPAVRHPLLGAWSYTDRKTWTDDFRTFGQAEPTPAPAPTPAPVPQSPEPLHSRTANTLTLRADFAAVVTRVDALANVIEPGNPSPMFIAATRSGNTWTLPQSLGSYPKGNRPNTWRIRLSGPPPAGVTYHTSIMQTFLREGDATTYPPTTRK